MDVRWGAESWTRLVSLSQATGAPQRKLYEAWRTPSVRITRQAHYGVKLQSAALSTCWAAISWFSAMPVERCAMVDGSSVCLVKGRPFSAGFCFV